VRDGQNVLQEAASNLITVAQYTDSPGAWGGLTSMRRSGSSSFFGFDLSSNTRLITGVIGTELATYLYDAFGIELSSSGSETNFLRFGGEVGYWRDLTNWMYVRARVLDSVKGRWDSRDPIGFDGGDWNVYRYVENRPVMDMDPSGKDNCIKIKDMPNNVQLALRQCLFETEFQGNDALTECMSGKLRGIGLTIFAQWLYCKINHTPDPCTDSRSKRVETFCQSCCDFKKSGCSIYSGATVIGCKNALEICYIDCRKLPPSVCQG
jgi:RHS repeat-associated protein